MKKLTAVSIRTKHGSSVHFVMLETERMVRCGVVDIKSRATQREMDAMWNNHRRYERGNSYSIT